MAWAAVAGAAISVVGSSMAGSSQADAAQSAADTSAGATNNATALQKQMYEQTRTDQAPWRSVGGQSINKLSQLMGMDVKKSYADPETKQAIYDRLKGQYVQNASPNTISQQMLDAIATTGMPFDTSAGTQTYDVSALNKAVDDEYARQLAQTGDYEARGSDFGSLAKNFSMADYQQDPGYQFRLDEGQKALERSTAARGGLQSGSALKAASRFGQDYASGEYQNAYNRYQSNQNNQYNRLASLAGVGQTANNSLQQAGTNYANSAGVLGMNSAANQGNAALVAGQARASSYGGIGKALGGVDWSKWNGGSGGVADTSMASDQADWSGSSYQF